MALEDDVERILLVTAHPDDVDFGSAGSVARWTDAGIEVAYCICTNGEAGGFDASVPRATMAEIRQAEQRAAAKVVGVTDVTFLGYPDVRPQRVVSQSPERNFQRMYASHPDHLAAGAATMAAVYPDSRNEFAHPELLEEGFEAWSVAEMYLVTPDTPDVFVDITDTFDRKLDALRSHATQMTDLEGLDARIRGWNAANAQLGGLAEGRLAESYLRIDTL